MKRKLINPNNLFIMTARSAYECHNDVTKTISLLDPTSYYSTAFKNNENNIVRFFEDEETLSFNHKLPNLMDIHAILEFVDKIKTDDIVIIHCEAGRSRSTAMAIGCLIYSGLSVEQAVEKVFEIRPKAIPNELILRLFEFELNLEEDEIKNFVHKKYRKNDMHFNWDMKKQFELKDDNDDLDYYLQYLTKINSIKTTVL